VLIDVALDVPPEKTQRAADMQGGQVPALDQRIYSAAADVQDAGDLVRGEQAFFHDGWSCVRGLGACALCASLTGGGRLLLMHGHAVGGGRCLQVII
jgi:hypothetical protein